MSRLLLLFLLIMPAAFGQVVDEESEKRFLEQLRQRFERDVGDLQKIINERGNVDQFMQQRLQQLLQDVGSGISGQDHQAIYAIEEEPKRYVVRLLAAIDSKIPCHINVGQKEIHFRGTLLAPISQSVDVRIPVPHDARANKSKIEMPPSGMVTIILPK